MATEAKFNIGLDVHKKSTAYFVRSWQGDKVIEGECSTRYSDLRSVLAPYYHSCVVGIEATTVFYPIMKGFVADGVKVKVANVIKIRELVAKNDALDAARLSDMLRLNSFPESFIPNEDIQKARDLLKVRHAFLVQHGQAKNRIWACLARAGVRIPTRSIFTKKGLIHLEGYLASGKASTDLQILYIHYKHSKLLLTRSTEELVSYVSSNFPTEWGSLQELAGIGPLMAAYLVAEICPISRFKNEKKLRRYAGVIPCTKKSGGKCLGSALPKSSSRALLRWALVEASHAAIRTKKSKLREYYLSRKKEKKKKAILAVASSMSDLVFKKLSSM